MGSPANTGEMKEGKIPAIVAYLTIVGALIAMSMNSEQKHIFARFHIRQAFGLHLCFIGGGLFLSVWFNEYAWYGLYVSYMALWFFGFWAAINHRMKAIPGIGRYFQRWFTFIQ